MTPICPALSRLGCGLQPSSVLTARGQLPAKAGRLRLDQLRAQPSTIADTETPVQQHGRGGTQTQAVGRGRSGGRTHIPRWRPMSEGRLKPRRNPQSCRLKHQRAELGVVAAAGRREETPEGEPGIPPDKFCSNPWLVCEPHRQGTQSKQLS